MWYNKCPISQITGCPDSSAWLDWYHQQQATSNEKNNNFVAINIGCNKGFDAVNLLRMGSNDDAITRTAWSAKLLSSSDGAPMLPSNCQQNSDATQYQIVNSAKKKDAVVFCVEPLSGTYQALRDAAKHTEYDQRGLHVLQLALNNEEPNTTLFPKADNSSSLLGAEKEGGNSCYSRRPSRAARLRENCEPVATTRLDRMVQQEEALRTASDIHVLLVDVEGWDFEVLQGGMGTLKKTHYIEFEYNWRGMWWMRKEEKPLRMAIDMLHNELHFTCYWPGGSKEGQLWRITGCFLPHYDGLFWSNVVCVNRELAPDLAERMEDIFLKTIGQDSNR
jgi:FkbM family methyltransferase